MESGEEMRITDLNIDCLKKIFQYLCLKDLLNTADSNKYMKQGSELTFSSKYRNNRVSIGAGLKHVRIYTFANEVIGTGVSLCCFKILRNFGHLIRTLSIFLHKSSSINDAILADNLAKYLENYCTDTLSSIKICGETEIFSKRLQKPFKNDDNVWIDNTYTSAKDNFVGKIVPENTISIIRLY